MAKKKTAKKKAANTSQALDLSLPQNIMPVGDQSQTNKRIYIAQDVYKQIHRFSQKHTTVERGGVLMGNVVEEFGKTHIIIRAFIEAKYNTAKQTELTFTHETWEYIHKVAEEKYGAYKIIGWIHTHPNFGIFLSGHDTFIQESVFSDENQVAYVVDPIQQEEGFFFWINQRIEKSSGFFVFDQTGKVIDLDLNEEAEGEDQATRPAGSTPLLKAVIGVMGLMIALLAVFCFMLFARINSLQEKNAELLQRFDDLESVCNNNFLYISQKLSDTEQFLLNVDGRLTALEPQPEPTETGEPAEGETQNG